MMMKHRINPLFIVGVAAISFGMLSAAQRPNIVFILSDDQGWADLSTGATNLGHPSDFYETPTLERLAKEGMAFTSAYVQPNCAPTRAALLSGQYAPRAGNGVYNVGSLNRGGKNVPLIPPAQNEDVPAKTVTVAEAFRAAGYVTAHFGKYHVGGHEGGASTLPEAAGFQFNFGGGKAGSPPGAYISRKTAGKWAFKKPLTPALDPFAKPYSKAYVRRHGISEDMIGKPKHLTDALADAFEDFLAKHESGAEADKPIYVHFWTHAVHSPIRPRADLAEKFTEKKKTRPSKTGHDNAKYAALISDLDQTVGRILKALDDPNGDGDTSDSIAADTLLVFASDNGGTRRATSNRPLRQFKGTFYEGGIRVPLIVRWPGKIKPGSHSGTLVHAVDFYPTFLEIAGIKPPGGQILDGVSFAGVLRSPDARRNRKPVFYHFPGYLDNRADPSSTVVADIGGQRYKLIYHYKAGGQGICEMYNLSKDIGEKENLLDGDAGDETLSIRRDLLGKLRAWLTQDTPGWQPSYPKERKSGKPLHAPRL